MGVDPYNKNADVQLSIERFSNEIIHASYDVVLVLGSINFGDKDTITNQMTAAAKLVKPGGKLFLRANPGITHINEYAKWVDLIGQKNIALIRTCLVLR